jgi:hypothetical protein
MHTIFLLGKTEGKGQLGMPRHKLGIMLKWISEEQRVML